MNYKVKIDSPCNQRWQEMTDVKDGKFCKHCCKTVTDFTHLGDQEVIKLLKQSSGNLCGRFTAEQLSREFREDEGKRTHWCSKIAASILLLLSAKQITANNHSIPRFAIETFTNPFSKQPIQSKELLHSDSTRNKITGRIINSDSVAVSRLRIFINGTSVSATSDIDGHFELSVPDSIKGIIPLRFSGIGYQDKIVAVDKRNLPVDLGTIYMSFSNPSINSGISTSINSEISSISSTVGGVYVSRSYGVYKRKWWQIWKKKYSTSSP